VNRVFPCPGYLFVEEYSAKAKTILQEIIMDTIFLDIGELMGSLMSYYTVFV
jgi:hypothetical protein